MPIITSNDPKQKAWWISARFGLILTWFCDALKMASSITARGGAGRGGEVELLTLCRSPATALSLQKLHLSTIHFVIKFFYIEAFKVPGNRGSCHGDTFQPSSCNTEVLFKQPTHLKVIGKELKACQSSSLVCAYLNRQYGGDFGEQGFFPSSCLGQIRDGIASPLHPRGALLPQGLGAPRGQSSSPTWAHRGWVAVARGCPFTR